jgi:predicted amidohydrolase
MVLFKVALLQLQGSLHSLVNQRNGIEACRQAKAMGADLALFPELWQIGYEAEAMRPAFAIHRQDPFLTAFQELAWELKMAIAVTYLGKGREKPTNSLAIINQKGGIILDYAKVHTCQFDQSENGLECGQELKVAPLEFESGCVNIGAMICFDREFPETARTLMLKGAEVIVTPNSCPMHNDSLLGDLRLQQLRARAFENMLGIALANYPRPKNDGHSCAIDVNGQFLTLADDQEGIFLATFDLDRMRKWQQEEVWGAKYRHPNCYSL